MWIFISPGKDWLLSAELSRLVSVVVCVKNRADYLAACLESIQANLPLEVIVVDGQSTDDSIGIARRFASTVVSDGGKGLAVARQLGAQTATGRYVAYVDSDVTLSNGCLAGLTEVLEAEQNVAAVHARIRAPTSTSYWARGAQARFDLIDDYTPGEKSALGCMAVVIRRNLILEYPFDPFFEGACEDEDFYFRLRRAGWRLRCGEPIAIHSHRQTLSSFLEQRIWYGRGSVRLAQKGHPKAKLGLLLHPANLLGVVFIWRALKAGRPELLPFIFVEAAAHYLGEILELKDLATRKLGPRRDQRAA